MEDAAATVAKLLNGTCRRNMCGVAKDIYGVEGTKLGAFVAPSADEGVSSGASGSAFVGWLLSHIKVPA